MRHGSPTARLDLRITAGNMAEAEVRDEGRWRLGAMMAPVGEEHGWMGLALARRVCDAVDIRAGDDGTTVITRMRLPPRPFAGRRLIRPE